MEKLYSALAWLAGVTLVLGLSLSIIWYTPLAVILIPQSGSTDGAAGSVGLFVSVFARTLFQQLYAFNGQNWVTLLVGGVTTLAMALAWVEGRRAWLRALFGATLLTLLWPAGVVAWQAVTFPSGPYPLISLVELENFLGFVVLLFPVALALIFARTRHHPSPTATADATLGLVRSPL